MLKMLLSMYCNLWKDYIFGTSRPKLGPRNLYFYNFLQIFKTELRWNNFDLKFKKNFWKKIWKKRKFVNAGRRLPSARRTDIHSDGQTNVAISTKNQKKWLIKFFRKRLRKNGGNDATSANLGGTTSLWYILAKGYSIRQPNKN